MIAEFVSSLRAFRDVHETAALPPQQELSKGNAIPFNYLVGRRPCSYCFLGAYLEGSPAFIGGAPIVLLLFALTYLQCFL